MLEVKYDQAELSEREPRIMEPMMVCEEGLVS